MPAAFSRSCACRGGMTGTWAAGIAAAALVMAALAGAALAHEAATGIVKERMDGMSRMGQAMKAINRRLRSGRELRLVQADARTIHELSQKIAAWFPQGSNQHPTDATEAVWTNWPDFEAKAQALARESEALARLDGNDAAALAAQYKRLAQTCGACHEHYRRTQ